MLHVYEVVSSIEIVSSPIINLILKIVIIILILVILKAVLHSIFKPHKGRYQPSGPARQDAPIRTVPIRTIEECVSKEDLKFQMNQAETEILNAVQRNRQEIKNTLRKANQVIDVSWLDSCNKILTISNTLDSNLAYYGNKILETSKFQYYAHLHFRSMIAANIVYNEYQKVDKSFAEINQFIIRMKSHPEFRGEYKNQVHSQKDQIKAIRNFYLNRVHNMNHETAVLRDKIGSECGERGEEWWRERMRHKG